MFYPYYYPYYNPYSYSRGYGRFGGGSLAFPFLAGFLLGDLFW